MPEAGMVGVLGEVAGGLAIAVWWLFFSRARWSERLGVVGLMIAGVAAIPLILHKSIVPGVFPVSVIPVLSLAFVV